MFNTDFEKMEKGFTQEEWMEVLMDIAESEPCIDEDDEDFYGDED